MKAPCILHPALTHKPDDPRALMAAIDAGGEWEIHGRLVVLKQHPVEAPSIPDNVVHINTRISLQQIAEVVPAFLRRK